MSESLNDSAARAGLERQRTARKGTVRRVVLLYLSAILAAAWGQIQLSHHHDFGWLGYLFAIGLSVVATRSSRPRLAKISLPPRDSRFRTRWWAIVVAVACSVLAFRGQASPTPNQTAVLIWWLLSLGFLLVPFFEFRTHRIRPIEVLGDAERNDEIPNCTGGAIQSTRGQWAEWGLLILLLGIAVLFRLPALERFPAAVHNDEANCGLMAQQILERRAAGEDYLFRFCDDFLNFPAIGFLPSAVGQAITRDPLYGHRLANVVLSLVSLVCFYLLARALYGLAVGYFALGLAVTAHVVVHWSRSGIHSGHATWLSVVVLFLVWKGISSGRFQWFVLTGFSLALSLLTYNAAYLLPPFLGLVFVVYWISNGEFRQKYWLPTLLCCIAALIFLSPMIAQYMKSPYGALHGKSQSMIWSSDPHAIAHMQAGSEDHPRWAMFKHNLRATSYLLQDSGDSNMQYGNRNIGIVDRITAVLFIFGLGVMLAHPDRHTHWPLLLLVGLNLLGGALLAISGVQYSRIAGLAMVVLLVPAIGFGQIFRSVSGAFGGRGAALICICGTVVLFWIGYENFHYYFIQYDQMVWHDNATLGQDAKRNVLAREVRSLGRRNISFVHSGLPSDFENQTFRFICDEYEMVAFDSVEPLLPGLARDYDSVTFMTPLEEVRRRLVASTGRIETSGSAISAEIVSRYPDGLFLYTDIPWHPRSSFYEAYWISDRKEIE